MPHLHCYHVNHVLVLIFSLLMSTSQSLSLTRPYHAKEYVRGNNRLFLDTAVIDEWTELLSLGIFHGITTNPVLLERAGHECTVSSIHSLATKALALPGCNEFMCQTWGVESDEMYTTGLELSEPDRDRIVVKVPVTYEGTKVASKLIEAGVRVCLTACYSSNHAMVAAGLGADYIAPYLGRMMDSGKDGVEECKKMQAIVNGMESKTRVLVASIRSANTMADLTSSGMNTFTFNPEIARELFDEDLTSLAAVDFNEAALRCGTDDEIL
eukprot:CAMPEP_0198275976 /NCGR_PEP_ID=MMETSP1447-20131203/65062_1 /TAXON_ID=420782 /ORGANISM="Chaetoceros dichaeta, Strain CCMP1751" /LENGTH=268 /DNA_ID=CAMNT_0043970885 /DNA_START=58 /DNA_END=864 /DNA_ORIENTATION=+